MSDPAGGPPAEDPLEDDDLEDDGLDDDDLDDDDLEDLDDEGLEDDGEGNRLVGGTPKAVLEYVARSIVDDPESVVVDLEERRRRGPGGQAPAVTLRLHVAPGDMGKVIGRRGRVAQAMRALVRAAGAVEGVDAQVDIVD